MAIPHPCCGGSLQTGSKIVAIVEMILSILSLLMGIGVLALGVTTVALSGRIANETSKLHMNTSTTLTHLNASSGNSTINFDPDVNKKIVGILGGMVIAGAVVLIICGLASLLLAVILWLGANARNASKCRIWLVIKGILILIGFVRFMASLSHNGGYNNGFSVVELSLNFYCLWIVYAFVTELREDSYTGGGHNGGKIYGFKA